MGYIELLRRNRLFRRVWYAQIASQLGDWFDTIALFALLQKLTGSGSAIGLLLVCQFLPATVVGLWSGVVVDRLSRRRVMVVTDLLSAALVLLFLLVRRADQVWIVYAVTVLKFSLMAFFEPARTAAIQQVTTRDELVPANAISGATWSAMLTLGAGLGGLAVAQLGTDAAFVIDAASFVASAAFVWRLPIPEPHLENRPAAEGGSWGQPLRELVEGFAFMVRRPDVGLYALVKTLWSLGGGIMVVLALFGQRVFPLGHDNGLSVGALYAARGVGAGVGPLLAQWLGGSSLKFLRRSIGPAFLCCAAGYALLAEAPSLTIALAVVLLAHLGGSTQWVFSTALLQLTVPNRLQGRIFAVELALLTLTTAGSNWAVGWAADAGWGPKQLARVMAGIFALGGVPLLLLLWPAPREEMPVGGKADQPAEPL